MIHNHYLHNITIPCWLAIKNYQFLSFSSEFTFEECWFRD